MEVVIGEDVEEAIFGHLDAAVVGRQISGTVRIFGEPFGLGPTANVSWISARRRTG